MIRNMADSGTTVFLSSHILADVQDIADRIGILNHGRILQVGTPDELQSHFQVGNVIEVVSNKGSPSLPDVTGVEGIEKVEPKAANKTLVHMAHDSDVDLVISQVLRRLMQSGCQLRNFSLVRPSLEDVYLKFVGGEA